MNVATIKGGIYTITDTIVVSVVGLGWVIGGILCAYTAIFSLVAYNAIREGKGIHVRRCFPWGLSFEVG